MNPEGCVVDGGNAELSMESVPTLVPDTVRRLPGAGRGEAGDAQAGAQIALEGIAHDHDARFDQHLLDGHVEGLHQTADVRQFVRGILHQQGIGALIDRQAAARRQHASSWRWRRPWA